MPLTLTSESGFVDVADQSPSSAISTRPMHGHSALIECVQCRVGVDLGGMDLILIEQPEAR